MNNNLFEQYLLAYSILYPKYLTKFDMSIISHSNYREIFKVLQVIQAEKDNDAPLSITAIKFKCAETEAIDLIELESVFSIIKNDVVNKTPIEVNADVNHIIEYLSSKFRRSLTIGTLRKAIKLVEDGKEMEGILAAKTIKFTGQANLKSTYEHMLDSVDETNIFYTGIERFDREIGGLANGNMMSIAGDTGSMKTMVSIWMCLSMLKANPKMKCLYFEKEMPVKDVARRVIAYLTSTTITDLMKESSNPLNHINHAIKETLEKNPDTKDMLERFVIVPNNHFETVSDMYRYIEIEKANIWCLDFLTQLGSTTASDGDFNKFTLTQAANLKNIIIETDTFGIVLNQIKKSSARARTNKIPTMDDIEWSGAISQYSAYIFSTFYPSLYYNDVPKDYFYLIGLKNRHHGVKHIPLHAEPQYCSFNSPPNMEYDIKHKWLDGYNARKSTESRY